MNIKLLSLIIITFFMMQALYSYEKYVDPDLVKTVSQPRFIYDGILITLPKNSGNIVYLRTDMDNWEKNYYFKKSQYDILYAVIPIKNGSSTIRYRINIDGFWDTDPLNKNMTEDSTGNKLSIVELPNEAKYISGLPEIEAGDTYPKKVYFRYYNPYAKEVNLVCSIDNWNVFTSQMTKNRYGYWEISKYFSRGSFQYYFYADGKKDIDIENKDKSWNSLKGEVSVFDIR